MLKIIDRKKMRSTGKEICKGYESFLQLKRNRLGGSDSTFDTFRVVSTAMSKKYGPKTVVLNFNVDNRQDIAETFLEACSCIARSDMQAGSFLLYKYFMQLGDDDIAEKLSVSAKALNAIKGRAYTLISYIAGKVYYVEEDDSKKDNN